MTKIYDWLEKKSNNQIQSIGRICGKIMDIPIVAAMTNGISAISSILIIGSLVAFINNFTGQGNLTISALQKIDLTGFILFTVDFFPIYLSISIGIYYGSHHKLPSLNCGLGSLIMFLFLQIPNFTFTSNSFSINDLSSFSSSGIFLSVLCSYLAVKIIYLCGQYKLVFKLNEQVPPAIYNSILVLVPYICIILISFFINNILNLNISNVLFDLLKNIIDNADSALTYTISEFLKALFWAFGLHGDYIVMPFYDSLKTYWTSANITAANSGVAASDLPHIWAGSISRYSMWISSAIPILIMTLRSKKMKELRPFALSCIPSTIFGIIEPLFYGLPVVMNPYFIIPLILSHTITGFTTYYAIANNWVDRISISLPWCLPAPILAYGETGGDFAALILVFINFVIGYLLFFPFFKAYENSIVDKNNTRTNKLRTIAKVNAR